MLSGRLADRVALAGSGGRFEPVPVGTAGPAKVSVVVPCYRYGHYLPLNVGRLLAEPGVDLEVIVVDDASPDGSADVARSLAAADPRVRAICRADNRGHIATYNEGIAAATGEFLLLLSADDLIAAGALARAAALLQAHPSVGFAYGRAVRFSGDQPPPARTEVTGWTLWSGPDWLSWRCRTGRNSLISPEVMIRTDLLRELGGYHPAYPHAADMLMWLLAASRADVGRVGGADQGYYRVQESNMHTSVFEVGPGGTGAGVLVDLGERWGVFTAAFERIAATGGPAAGSVDRLRRDAGRAVATEALGLAARARIWRLDDWPVDDLVAFARQTFPEAERLPAWRAYRRCESWHRRPDALLGTALKSRERMLRVGRSWAEWRWRQATA